MLLFARATALVTAIILQFCRGQLTPLWTRETGTSGTDERARAVVMDTSNNIYVTGYIQATLDGQSYSGGTYDIVIIKYNSAGTKLWTRITGTPQTDGGLGIATYGANNFYVSGYVGASYNGDTYIGGSSDIVLIKYDSSGARQWSKMSGSTGADQGFAVATDTSGNVYVAGQASATIDGQTYIGGTTDIVLLKYDQSGNKIWTKLAGTALSDQSFGVAIDSSSNVYVTGFAQGIMNGQAYVANDDLVLIKFDSTGSQIWARLVGTSGRDQGLAITVDGSDNIYVTGLISGTVDGQTYVGGTDVVLLKYDVSGNKLWTRLAGTLGNDAGNGVSFDSTNNVLVTGSIAATFDGQAYAGGTYDVVLFKYDSSGNRQSTVLIGTGAEDAGLAVDVYGGNLAIVGYTAGTFAGQTLVGATDLVTFYYSLFSSSPTSQPSGQPTRQPSSQPTGQPSCQPSLQPMIQPTAQPSFQPTNQPTCLPTDQPSRQPTSQPSRQPSEQPVNQPTAQPSANPTRYPSAQPSSRPSAQPTVQPTYEPTMQPTMVPSSQPSSHPSQKPSNQPSASPTVQPSRKPSSQPTGQPSTQPSVRPSSEPTNAPSAQPSCSPSTQPSSKPSESPSCQPSSRPSTLPTSQPSAQPSLVPSSQPTFDPSAQPSEAPTSCPSTQPSAQPSYQPSEQPSAGPSVLPSSKPSSQPTASPSILPTALPSTSPSYHPLAAPTSQPTSTPSTQPTLQPSGEPSRRPSSQPSGQPTDEPSVVPTSQPTDEPSSQPTQSPTSMPTSLPSASPSTVPSSEPSNVPSAQPTQRPSSSPSTAPSAKPSGEPSMHPSSYPSAWPTSCPSSVPTLLPTSQPSDQPTVQPTRQPSPLPASSPSLLPTSVPSRHPSTLPTSQPISRPSSQPSIKPSLQPKSKPSSAPSSQPSFQPTGIPSAEPSFHPSSQPTSQPSSVPSALPSTLPSFQPTVTPTSCPSSKPSRQPFSSPTTTPSSRPSLLPSSLPTSFPSAQPSSRPTTHPSAQPVSWPTVVPSCRSSAFPSRQPSVQPSLQPRAVPSSHPSSQPTGQLSHQPSRQPSSKPSSQPIRHPSSQPTRQPSRQPSRQPTSQPSLAQSTYLSTYANKLAEWLRNATSANQQLSLISDFTSTLQSLFASLQGTTDSSLSIVTDKARILLSQMIYSPGVNATAFLPSVTVPGTQTSVSVAIPQSVSNANATTTRLIVSVVDVDKNAVTAASMENTQNSSVISSIPLKIVSDVVSVKLAVVTNGSSTTTTLPSFVANISLTDNSTKSSNVVFTHNCTVGLVESVSFLCPGSLMRYNLTCSGKTAVRVHRQCPVAQKVCNVLNMQTLSVMSTDFCTATQSSGGYVVCSCGLSNNTKSTSASTILATGGSVNVAVMTQYIAGDFGTIGGSGGVSVSAFAQQSSSIFIVFGCLWGFGVILMVFHYSHDAESSWKKKVLLTDDKKQKQMMSVLPESTSVASLATVSTSASTAVSGIGMEEQVWSYIQSVLPISYQVGPWWERLWRLMSAHHGYCRAAVAFVEEVRSHDASSQGQHLRDQRRKKAMLDILQLLTLAMVSFLVLALLYDFQYPADDGSCELYTVKDACLTRRSLLDNHVTYCTWHPELEDSVNTLVESRTGTIIQRIVLDDDSSSAITQCKFNNSESSILITVLSIVITSIVSIPVDVVLTYLFGRIGARSTKQVFVQAQASQISAVVSLSRSPVVHGKSMGNRRAGLVVPPMRTLPSDPRGIPRMTSSNDLRTQGGSITTSDSHQQLHDQPGASLAKSTSMQCLRLPPKTTLARSQLHTSLSDANLHLTGLTARHLLRHQQMQYTRRLGHLTPDDAIAPIPNQVVLPSSATDSEYGVGLLHAFISELLVTSAKSPMSERVYRYAVSEAFPLEAPAVSDTMKGLFIFCVASINIGSLIFIALKGIQRGQAWQGTFLWACAVEWVTDVLFVSVMEVLLLNIVLPSFAVSVTSQVCHRLRLLTAAFSSNGGESCAHRLLQRRGGLRGGLFSTHSSRTTLSGDGSSSVAPEVLSQPSSVSHVQQHAIPTTKDSSTKRLLLASLQARPWLWESTFIQYAIQKGFLDHDDESSFSHQNARALPLVYLLLETLPVEVLRFLVSLSASMALGGLLYVNFLVAGIEQFLPSEALQTCLFLTVVGVVLFTARTSLLPDKSSTATSSRVIVPLYHDDEDDVELMSVHSTDGMKYGSNCGEEKAPTYLERTSSSLRNHPVQEPLQQQRYHKKSAKLTPSLSNSSFSSYRLSISSQHETTTHVHAAGEAAGAKAHLSLASSASSSFSSFMSLPHDDSNDDQGGDIELGLSAKKKKEKEPCIGELNCAEDDSDDIVITDLSLTERSLSSRNTHKYNSSSRGNGPSRSQVPSPYPPAATVTGPFPLDELEDDYYLADEFFDIEGEDYYGTFTTLSNESKY